MASKRGHFFYFISKYRLQFLILIFLRTIDSCDNEADVQLDSAVLGHSLSVRSIAEDNTTNSTQAGEEDDIICPDLTACNELGGSCINCSFNYSCIYGKDVTVTCTANLGVNCTGSRTFSRKFNCRYCYQTSKENHLCEIKTDCKVVASPPERTITNCTVKDDILCLGRRKFPKSMECNWTSGYRWSTSVILSLTLGGFGVDRFYLGHWDKGLGKLFSFGGLGVWTIVDFILICIGVCDENESIIKQILNALSSMLHSGFRDTIKS